MQTFNIENFVGIVTAKRRYLLLQRAPFAEAQVTLLMKNTFPRYRLLATLTKIRIMNGLFIKQIRFTVSTKMLTSHCIIYENMRRDVLPFVQFKKREKHPWRSVYFSVFYFWLFSRFLNYKWYQIAQSTSYVYCNKSYHFISKSRSLFTT